MQLNITSSDGSRTLQLNNLARYWLRVGRYGEIVIEIGNDLNYLSLKVYNSSIPDITDIQYIYIELESIFQVNLSDSFKHTLKERLTKNRSFAYYKGDLLAILQA
jgi:hypothetical protein